MRTAGLIGGEWRLLAVMPLNVSLRVTAPADEQAVGSRLQTEVGVGIMQCVQGRSNNFGAVPGESQQL